jgi:hypothetical protein
MEMLLHLVLTQYYFYNLSGYCEWHIVTCQCSAIWHFESGSNVKKVCLDNTTQTEALYLHVPALVKNVFSITVSFVFMVYWFSHFVRWRCWHMIIGWGWCCGSVFSAYLLTLPRSICKLFCGFFLYCTLKRSVGGSGANLIILFCQFWVTVHWKNLYVWFLCTSLFSCIC